MRFDDTKEIFFTENNFDDALKYITNVIKDYKNTNNVPVVASFESCTGIILDIANELAQAKTVEDFVNSFNELIGTLVNTKASALAVLEGKRPVNMGDISFLETL